jgi:hypothetical protein
MTVTKPARALLACAGAVILASGVTACGGGGGDESAVKDRVKTTFSGFADKDSGKICNSLSERYKKRIAQQPLGKGKQSCEKSIGLVLTLAGNALKDVGNTKVGKVSVNGDKATADISYKSGKKNKVALVKEGGDWRVDDFSLQKR